MMKSLDMAKKTFPLVILMLIFVTLATPVYSALQTSKILKNSGSISSRNYLFSTGFETGDTSEVDELEVNSPGIVTVTTDSPFKGLYSAKMWTDDGGPEGRVRLNYNFWPGKNELYIRTYFNVDYWEGYITILRFASCDPSIYLINVDIASGYVRLGIGEAAWHPDPDPGGFKYNTSISTDTWYCIEAWFKRATNGGAKVWLNGVEVISYSGNTSSAPEGIEVAKAGYVLYQDLGPGHPSQMFIDEYVVDDEYIGL